MERQPYRQTITHPFALLGAYRTSYIDDIEQRRQQDTIFCCCCCCAALEGGSTRIKCELSLHFLYILYGLLHTRGCQIYIFHLDIFANFLCVDENRCENFSFDIERFVYVCVLRASVWHFTSTENPLWHFTPENSIFK